MSPILRVAEHGWD